MIYLKSKPWKSSDKIYQYPINCKNIPNIGNFFNIENGVKALTAMLICTWGYAHECSAASFYFQFFLFFFAKQYQQTEAVTP